MEQEKALASSLRDHGFDICHPFHSHWYNHHIENEGLPLVKIPSGQSLLIGNTKHLWPIFLRWLRQNSDPLPSDPLERYCTETISTLVMNIFSSVKHDIFWSHQSSTPLVSMQRVAHVSGLAFMEPTTKLSIHPLYGTWLAFRAVVVFHTSGSCENSVEVQCTPNLSPLVESYRLSQQEQEAADSAMKHALYKTNTTAESIHICRRLHGGEGMLQDDLYKDWIALRDVVSIGRKDYRYSEGQLMYHYTKDLQFLKNELEVMNRKHPGGGDEAKD